MNCLKKLCMHHGSTRTGCKVNWNPSNVHHIHYIKHCDSFDVTVKLTNRKEISYMAGWNTMLKTRTYKMGLDMKKLARKAGLSQPTVSAVLTNGRKPKMDTLRSICKVLNYELSDIISGNTDFVRGNYNV